MDGIGGEHSQLVQVVEVQSPAVRDNAVDERVREELRGQLQLRKIFLEASRTLAESGDNQWRCR